MKILLISTLWLSLVTPLVAAPVTEPRTDQPARRGEGAATHLERLLTERPVLNGTLSLNEAVATALRESPVVRGAAAEVEAAVGRVEAARAETRPWLSANAFLSGGNNANTIATSPVTQPQMIMGLPPDPFFDANLMLMYPLYTGGRLRALIRQAAAQREVSQAELEAQRQEVALLTRAAYRAVLARRALVEVWQARLQEDQERLRVDRARLAQQQVPPFYVLRDEAEQAATQQELTNARRDVELSLVQLKTVMGVSPASRIDVIGPLEFQPSGGLIQRLTARAPAPARELFLAKVQEAAPPVDTTALPPDMAPLLRLAERQRPELQAAGQRVRGAQAETAAVRNAYRPQVNAAAMGDFIRREGEDRFLGVTFGLVASMPLYNGGQRRARIQTAEAERRRQEQERERVALQVAQEVNTALLNLRAAEQNVQTAQAALTAAREDYRVALLRYESGRSIVVEALDALAARVRAESNIVQALFQYNVAQDQLLRAVGELDAPVTPAPPPSAPGSPPVPPPGEKQEPSPSGAGGARGEGVPGSPPGTREPAGTPSPQPARAD